MLISQASYCDQLLGVREGSHQSNKKRLHLNRPLLEFRDEDLRWGFSMNSVEYFFSAREVFMMPATHCKHGRMLRQVNICFTVPA